MTRQTLAPRAFSYIRFSSGEQAKGDSLRRQTAATDAWCERNGVVLDTTVSYRDAGVSGFRGKHRSDKAALGKFVDAVKAGRVPHGSYLVIENLDRLSREEVRTAVKLWIDLLDLGVNIVTLTPERVYRHDRTAMEDIMLAVVELSRGHSESAIKSARTKANWVNLRQHATEGKARVRKRDGAITKVLTRRLPSWLEERDGQPALIAERVAVVRRVFALSAQGLGATAICKKLTAEGVPAFGERDVLEDGRTKTRGEHYGCGEWRTSYVRNLLKDRRLLGEFQPMDAANKPVGEPIVGYYPRALADREFREGRAGAANRRNPPRERIGGKPGKRGLTGKAGMVGRIGKGVPNLFAGLLVHARDGQSIYAACRNDNGSTSRVLLNRTSVEGKSHAYTFPLATFEAALLASLREVDPAEVFALPSVVRADAAALRDELRDVRARKSELATELSRGGPVSVIANELRTVEAREGELAAKLADADEQLAVPLAHSYRDARTLAERLADAPDAEEARLRLRAALRRTIEGIHVLVVPRLEPNPDPEKRKDKPFVATRDRIAAVTICFCHSTARRNLLIFSRSTRGNQNGSEPGAWAYRNIKHPDDGLPFSDFDLRNKNMRVMEDGASGRFYSVDGAAEMEAFLTRYPRHIVDSVLAAQPEPSKKKQK